MKPLAYKHYFNVVDGKYVWENLDMFNLIKRTLEGKRGYAIIEEETESVSSNQLAFYFGGIIRQECMNSNCFAGLSEKEIHNYLLIELRGTMRTIRRPAGGTSIAEMPGDFDDIMRSKKKMAGYLEDVIAHLQLEFDIYVKPSEHYKANGYIVKTKHYGIAKES
jgi:hypothetical protein